MLWIDINKLLTFGQERIRTLPIKGRKVQLKNLKSVKAYHKAVLKEYKKGDFLTAWRKY